MKPILFNTEMVKAILDGRKTQTRRVVNKEYLGMADIYDNNIYVPNEDGECINILKTSWSKYKVGDVLYVKEKCVDEYPNGFCFKEDYEEEEWNNKYLIKQYCNKLNARIFLKVTNVRVERLQDIEFCDVFKEGIELIQTDGSDKACGDRNLKAFNNFVNIWNSTAKDGYKWEDNPYVFVYEFERVDNGTK